MKTLNRCIRPVSLYMIERNCLWIFKPQTPILKLKKTWFHDEASGLAEQYKEFILRNYYTYTENSGIQAHVIKVINERICHTSKLIRQHALKWMLWKLA
jgi:hypothetical protein